MFRWQAPEGDDQVRTIAAQAEHLQRYYKHCKKFDYAVQAGGNIGIWPEIMSLKFATVYTFEPQAQNFSYLVKNCTAQNVWKYQCALGDVHGAVGMISNPQNMGASFISGDGVVPVVRLDDFRLPGLDFLMLDVEGYEINAVRGAYKTIQKYKPTVVTEIKGLFDRYHLSEGNLNQLMAELGYKRVDKAAADVVWSCE